MQHVHDFNSSNPADRNLDALAKTSSELGFEIVDIAGFLDTIEQKSRDQLSALHGMKDDATRVIDANTSVMAAIQTMAGSTKDTLATVEKSVALVRESGQHSQTMAEWVQELNARASGVENTVEAMRADNQLITSIAAQVNILAINAKIEAGRAGAAGRGFAVVAEAINDLSKRTTNAAAQINTNIKSLSNWIQQLSAETEQIAASAAVVLKQGRETDQALSEIETNAQLLDTGTSKILNEANTVKDAIESFAPSIRHMGRSVEETSKGIHETHHRVENLVNSSERLVQGTVALGGATADSRFITFATDTAQKISALFADAVRSGRISEADMFDKTYRPIAGSNPEQVLTRYTELTDQLLPPLLEAALQFDQRVAFCAALDVNGYLPTHNKKFSQPQGDDPVWNTANCRNRRIFNDRVGLKAGRNTEPFLMQVYRRDMGGGKFVLMKDLSVPIHVGQRHWGGLRLGFTI